MHGAAIKSAANDKAIDAKLAAKGMNVKEGSCKDAGFGDRIWHKDNTKYAVWVSVWSR